MAVVVTIENNIRWAGIGIAHVVFDVLPPSVIFDFKDIVLKSFPVVNYQNGNSFLVVVKGNVDMNPGVGNLIVNSVNYPWVIDQPNFVVEPLEIGLKLSDVLEIGESYEYSGQVRQETI